METVGRPSIKQIATHAVYDFFAFAIPFTCDAAIGSAIFGGLLWFAWLFGLGRVFGISEQHLKALEDAHFCLNYGLFVAMGLSFVVRMLRRIFRGGS